MANFSFDHGNAHWTVLDANPYVDWTDRELRAWLQRDLASASGATWRFVAFHQPGFNSARKHSDEENMRQVADLLEAGKVDVVFCGHVHNYQRSFPLTFRADRTEGNPPSNKKGLIGGTVDPRPVVRRHQPNPGAGCDLSDHRRRGASLYNPEQQDDPASWKEFTHKFISKVHSLTIADVEGPKLTVRQVSLEGEELDRFVLTR